MGQVYTASNRTIYAWGIGAVADMFLIGTFGLIMPIFNTSFGFDAVLISWAVTASRLFDALLDPLLGHLSDHTHTRWGRRRPYLAVGSLLGAIALMGIWWPSRSWSSGMQFLFVLVASTLFYSTWGIYSMAHMALGYELTDDYHERTKIVAVRTLFSTIAGLATGWVYWLALRPVFGGEISGIRWVSAGLGIGIIVTGLIPAICCKERFGRSNPKPVPIFQSLKTALLNKPFVHLLLMKITGTLGNALFIGQVFYLNTYYVCRGDKSLAMQINGVNALIYTAWSFVLLPVAPRISRRIGKRNCMILGTAMAAVTAIMQPLMMTPDFPYLQVMIGAILAPGWMLGVLFLAALVPDVCDLDELETGQRREGLFGSVMGFVAKLESSVCVLIVGYLVSLAGFDPKLSLQPDEVLTKLRWFGYTPNIVFTLLTLWLAWRFPIHESMMNQVRATLDARRAQNGKSKSERDAPRECELAAAGTEKI